MTLQPRRFDAVTVFGGATLDRVARTAAAPVMGASNPGTVRRLPGGVGLNIASILARLGVRVRLVSRVGMDPDAEIVRHAAKAAGIDTEMLEVSETSATGAYHAAFDNTGNLIVGVADMTICDEMVPASMPESVLAGGPSMLWVLDANLPPDTIAFLAEEASTRHIPLAALSVSPAKAARLIPVLDRLALLFTNRREAPVLTGSPVTEAASVSELAAALAASRQASVIVTDGAAPLALAQGNEVRSFAPLRARVAGVNGAGDSFAGGTLQGIAEGLPLRDAIRHGLAAAVLTLEAGSVVAAPFLPGALSSVVAASRAAP